MGLIGTTKTFIPYGYGPDVAALNHVESRVSGAVVGDERGW